MVWLSVKLYLIMNIKPITKMGFRKSISALILLCFLSGQVFLPSTSYAQSILNLPTPGAMVSVSPGYVPLAIKGLKVYPENPFRFDFILDTGNSKLEGEALKAESNLLIKYFLAALTVPDDEQWVNLSPYEKDRVIPSAFGITEMGRDLLAQDYLLKQLTASLIYPEHDLGKTFWERVRKKAYEKYRDVDIPLNTFNKVWIMPDHAKVYESGSVAFITESHLKVMLEEDYVAAAKQTVSAPSPGLGGDAALEKSAVFREVILPEIEKEVNEGKNFAKLRQIYHSMIMAAWFKRKLKDGVLGRIYVGANKVAGVQYTSSVIAGKEKQSLNDKELIYQQYLTAFKKGVYDYIKEETDDTTQETTPRKYFAGGIVGKAVASSTVFEVAGSSRQLSGVVAGSAVGEFVTASSVLDVAKADRVADDQIKLAEELSPEEFTAKWEEYVKDLESIIPGFTTYTALLDLFTDDIKKALLDDLSLRPVFLQILPEDSLGELVISDQDLVDTKIGDKTLLDYMNQYRGFKIGTAEVANDLLLSDSSMKIIVGIVDRDSEKTLYKLHRVANGRQVFFPLPDGTWLGIKGAGQFLDETLPPHHWYVDTQYPDNTRYHGVATLQEAQMALATTSYSFAKNNALFVQFLGYQRVYKLPDGNGHLVPTQDIINDDGSPLNTVLIFNRMAYPQRLVKLPQMLEVDRDLKRSLRKISMTLHKLGLLEPQKILNASEWMLMIAKKRGQTEAVKQNAQWFKETIHSQDITFAGEETDNEEFMPYEVYLPTQWDGNSRYANDVLIKYRLNIAGIENMIKNFLDIIIMMELSPEQLDILIPSPTEVLKVFFQSYFASLDDEYLKIWTIKNENLFNHDFPRSLPIANLWLRIDVFHPETLGFNKQDDNLIDRVHTEILSWAQEEVTRRLQKNKDQLQELFGLNKAVASAPTAESAAKSDNLGGIDMNQKALDLQTEGDEIKFDMPFDPTQLQNIQIDGFSPVIIQIAPTNLPLFIGSKEIEDQKAAVYAAG